jgi:hypothetical protein
MHNCGGKPQKMAPTHRDKELVILNIIAVATTTNPHIMYIHNVDAVAKSTAPAFSVLPS